MMPFDSYPVLGLTPLGKPKNGANCRHGYGLELQRLTGQTRCAYCQMDLVQDYDHWLLSSRDHVVPRGQAIKLGVGIDLYEDFINLVLCCTGCNGFGNRYAVISDPMEMWGIDAFIVLRDHVFAERTASIALRRAIERAFFQSAPWIDPSSTS